MMKASESPYRVIVMGKTGSGKSSVLNSLTHNDFFKVGDSILSETKEVQTFKGKFKNRLTSPDIVFIDTPGFFDSSSRDNKVIAKIAMSLHQVEDGLNLVLFCFPAYEIRLDSSMQASWRFLKLVMGRAVYEHVVIVLTHGNRLTSAELENAVKRMTTEFIPYLKNNLKCKVKEEILIYRKGEENDGLEDVLKYITSNEKYKPKVMEDLGRFWKPEDPLGSIEYLLQNSEIFNKIQDLLSEVQSKNEDMQDQMEKIKQEMEDMANLQEKQVNLGLNELKNNVKNQFEEEKAQVAVFKDDVEKQIRSMQKQLDDKNKQIELLRRDLEEVKIPAGSASGSNKNNLGQIPLTTRAEKKLAWEERPATTDRESERHGLKLVVVNENVKVTKEEEIKHSKQNSKDLKYAPGPVSIAVQPHIGASQPPYSTKAHGVPITHYNSSPAQQIQPKILQNQVAAKPPATIMKPQFQPSKGIPQSSSKPLLSKVPNNDYIRPPSGNPQAAPGKNVKIQQNVQVMPPGKIQIPGVKMNYPYTNPSATPKNPNSRYPY